MLLTKTDHFQLQRRQWRWADLILLAGALLLLVPPMIKVAQVNWATDQGGHGPIVLATGLWLLARELRPALQWRQPGNGVVGGLLLLALTLAAVVFGITGILELQVASIYGALLCGAYLLLGGRVLRTIWFPLFYLAFALPPPDTVVAVLTNPVKIAISETAVSLLYQLGYPVGSSGVVIQIAQYQLLVAAACSGLNSLITLSAIGLFYVYLRHRSEPRALVLMSLVVVPVAILANFIRVLTLILITYYVSEAAAQGFIHDFAGLVTFSAALAAMLAIETVYTRFAARRGKPANG